jgi:alpha-galactosidase
MPDTMGNWLEPCRNFPTGLEAGIKAIAEAGYKPGIFFMPYAAGSNSRVAREHPDWLLRWSDGSLVSKNRLWTDDQENFILDLSHPEAAAYLEQLFRKLYSLGVRTFKTDFMEWGFIDSTKVRRHTPAHDAQGDGRR